MRAVRDAVEIFLFSAIVVRTAAVVATRPKNHSSQN